MEDIPSFRGLSGEVVLNFIRPGTFFSAIPVILFYAVSLLSLFYVLPSDAQVYGFLAVVTLSAIPVGRFAIPASQGKFSSGWFNSSVDVSQTIAFALRYTAFTAVWCLPVVLVYLGVAKINGLAGMNGINLFNFSPSNTAGIFAILFFIACVFFLPGIFYFFCQAPGFY